MIAFEIILTLFGLGVFCFNVKNLFKASKEMRRRSNLERNFKKKHKLCEEVCLKARESKCLKKENEFYEILTAVSFIESWNEKVDAAVVLRNVKTNDIVRAHLEPEVLMGYVDAMEVKDKVMLKLLYGVY